MEKDDKYFEGLQKYLGLENREQAEFFDLVETELLKYGNWGSKISAYLRSIFCKNIDSKSYIPKEDRELLDIILKNGLDIIDYNNEIIQTKNKKDV